MTSVRPKAALLGLAVLSLLLAGCDPTDQPTRPVVDSVTTTPAADATTEATPATESTGAPATTAAAKPKAKPAGTPAAKPATHQPSPKPSPKPTTKPPSERLIVHPGAFCSPEGAIGYTSKGTRMRCTLKSGEDRARWRAA